MGGAESGRGPPASNCPSTSPQNQVTGWLADTWHHLACLLRGRTETGAPRGFSGAAPGLVGPAPRPSRWGQPAVRLQPHPQEGGRSQPRGLGQRANPSTPGPSAGLGLEAGACPEEPECQQCPPVAVRGGRSQGTPGLRVGIRCRSLCCAPPHACHVHVHTCGCAGPGTAS